MRSYIVFLVRHSTGSSLSLIVRDVDIGVFVAAQYPGWTLVGATIAPT